MQRTSSAKKAPHVRIVSASDETSRELQRYLEASGLSAAGNSELRHAKVDAYDRALVLFPDDFAADEVIAHLQAARAERLEATLIVVTAHPDRFKHAVARDGSMLGVIVLPRPAFGWAILEAIRADAH